MSKRSNSVVFRSVAALVLGAAVVAVLTASLVQGQDLKFAWTLTTDQARWTQQPPLQLAAAPARPPADAGTVVIDPGSTDQPIVGWGGCFNELGWKALLTLPLEARAAVLRTLFDPQADGLRFNLCRIPMGASDFALDGYSLDDTKDDYELQHFSIDRDRQLLIPYVKAAMAYRPDLKVWASPWSPPGWMKDNGVYHGGKLRMEPKILEAYARYFIRFVRSYQGEGIDLYAVHVQNEPVSDSNYPTCPWKDPAPLRDFIRDYLGPAFAADKTPAQIWLGTMSESRLPWFKVILDDPGAARYIAGIGLQYEGRKACQALHQEYPQWPLIETETPCHAGANSWSDAENSYAYYQQFLGGGVQAYTVWNMVLDQTGMSSWHWRQNSPVVIDTHTGTVTYTPEFYLTKHFSYFVRPGAVRLKLMGTWSDALAFRNPDGTIVLIVANVGKSASDKVLTLQMGDRFGTVTIPAHSFSTFVGA